MRVSIYKNVTDVVSSETIEVRNFLYDVRSGRYEDSVNAVRLAKTDEEKNKCKKMLPNATLSGVFSRCTDAGLTEHSGLICMDFDSLDDTDAWKNTLAQEEFIYSIFVSAGGHGLAVLCRVEGTEHRLMWEALADYFYTTYKIGADPTGINVSRRRFYSYDPHIYINDGAKAWKKKAAAKKNLGYQKGGGNYIITESDVSDLIAEIGKRGTDITGGYADWIRICFGLIHKYGAGAREYFHVVSSNSSKYDAKDCDRQFDRCLRHSTSGNECTMGTVYWYAQRGGFTPMSSTTQMVMKQASLQKKAGVVKSEDIVKNITGWIDGLGEDVEVDMPKGEDLEDIVRQVMESSQEIKVNGEDEIPLISSWLVQNFKIRRNMVTGMYDVDFEHNGKRICGAAKERQINTIYFKTRPFFGKISFEMFAKVLCSEYIPEFHPIKEWLEGKVRENPKAKTKGYIEKLFKSIPTDTGVGVVDDYAYYFGKKWIVGIIANLYGDISPLMLFLVGKKQGTGKTEFFRRLLPDVLKEYYAESKIVTGKDDLLMLAQNMIVMDDELSGKSVNEQSLLKDILSKKVFTLRVPYGRTNENIPRLAGVGATSNNEDVLKDRTGNRRMIPIRVISQMDFDMYAEAVEDGLLWVEAYHEYMGGYNYRILGEDIELLNRSTTEFEEVDENKELIMQYYGKPNSGDIGEDKYVTASMVASRIYQYSSIRLNTKVVGTTMKDLGFEQKSRKNVPGFEHPVKAYHVIEKEYINGQTSSVKVEDESDGINKERYDSNDKPPF